MLGLLVGPGCWTEPGPTSPHKLGDSGILFASGFGNAVRVSEPVILGGQYYQFLEGRDLGTGFNWDTDLPEEHVGAQLEVSGTTSDPETYVRHSLQVVPNETAVSDTVLWQYVARNDPTMPSTSRSQYTLRMYDTTQAYESYWLYLQPDLDVTMSSPGGFQWRQLFELKTWVDPVYGTHDYRIYILIAHNDLYGLHYRFESQTAQQFNAGLGETDWSYVVTSSPVPYGKWCFVEVFWKLGTIDGQFWVRVDGNVLVHHVGNTLGPNQSRRVSQWNFLKAYGPEEIMPIWQYVDDIEIWKEMPINR